MHFSLIMGTVGRVAELERFLESLDAQTYREFELIVVDQNEDERLAPVLDSYKHRFTILRLKSDLGLSRARNVGLSHVSGDALAFPDDDCWYSPDLLLRVAAILDDQPKLGGVTGRIVDEHGGKSIARFDAREGPLTWSNVWRRVSSQTAFLRRDVVEQVGGFDETLGVGAGTPWGGGEDIDYPLRAVRAGYRICYKPDIYVFHPNPPEKDQAKLARRAFDYGAGIGRVWRKHDYPAWFVAYYLLRPLGGSLLSLASGRMGKAYYRWRSFRGRLAGWLS